MELCSGPWQTEIQHSGLDQNQAICFITLCLVGSWSFLLPCPSSAFHFTAWAEALHKQSTTSYQTLIPTLLWLVSNYTWSDLLIQIQAIIWSVGRSTLTLLCWVATVLQALSAFPSSFLTYWSLHTCTEQLMTQGKVWHIQAVKRHKTYTLRPKKMLQLNAVLSKSISSPAKGYCYAVWTSCIWRTF